MGLEIHSDFLPDSVEIDMEHMSESEAEDREIEWEESEYNYRLNHCESTLYAVIDNNVVGHLGLKDGRVETVFVDSSNRGNGVGIELYEAAFKEMKGLKSSHITAMESAAKAIWRSLAKRHPNEINFDKHEGCWEWES